MFPGDSTPLTVRGQSHPDRIFHHLCTMLFSILECPPLESLSGSFGRGQVGRSHMTPVAFASLLFGIASTLMFIGSTAFMIGIIMMPFVAMVAMFFSFIGIFVNLSVPGMGFWSRSGSVSVNGGRENCTPCHSQ
eukprot:Gb_21619 [translate_table: standard]